MVFIRKWLLEDAKLLDVFTQICKFDVAIGDHNGGKSKRALTHFVVVQRYENRGQGWKRLERKEPPTHAGHDDAWCCSYAPYSDFCKNPLYVHEDEQLHLSTCSSGMDFIADECLENILWQQSRAYTTPMREINEVISMQEARALLQDVLAEKQTQQARKRPATTSDKQ